ncbi:Hypothetical_protein [Hexamita inflata]|uniref:Hypothetical_protein n=1 Tax=Hexamita inflata TaxID=28002 RepID=A0AA86P611_9EUKA|nr:Hypothetical protein HINF_LOCUS19956 [Hexamita inflata]CAI9932318.1 Hypothetical protein HINF_LOCUS19963 [Hexamita inflata]CAI9968520.1 Hypothetical protein HINF_LOCUS56165 [Hexamita inflata]
MASETRSFRRSMSKLLCEYISMQQDLSSLESTLSPAAFKFLKMVTFLFKHKSQQCKDLLIIFTYKLIELLYQVYSLKQRCVQQQNLVSKREDRQIAKRIAKLIRYSGDNNVQIQIM